MSENIIEINADRFDEVVLGSTLAIVDFYSSECPPCEDLAKNLDVSGSPTLLFFKDRKRVGPKLAGGIRRSEIMKNLDEHLSPERVKEQHGKIEPKNTVTDVVILGGGPAGLTAGICTHRRDGNRQSPSRRLCGHHAPSIKLSRLYRTPPGL